MALSNNLPGFPLEKPRFHPLVELFPEMDKAAFADLVADIKAHGVYEPSTLYNNQVVDGKHRELACWELGIVCPRVAYQGKESALLDFVLSKNLHRRHLDASQRSMVAAKIATMRQGTRTDLQPKPNLAEVSIADAAKRMQVSTGSVKTAKSVIAKGVPEIAKAVVDGKLKVSTAAKIVEHPPAVQHDAASKITAGAKPADVVRPLSKAAASRAAKSAARRDELDRRNFTSIGLPLPHFFRPVDSGR